MNGNGKLRERERERERETGREEGYRRWYLQYINSSIGIDIAQHNLMIWWSRIVIENIILSDIDTVQLLVLRNIILRIQNISKFKDIYLKLGYTNPSNKLKK